MLTIYNNNRTNYSQFRLKLPLPPDEQTSNTGKWLSVSLKIKPKITSTIFVPFKTKSEFWLVPKQKDNRCLNQIINLTRTEIYFSTHGWNFAVQTLKKIYFCFENFHRIKISTQTVTMRRTHRQIFSKSIKSTRNQIVYIIFRLIWIQTDGRLVPKMFNTIILNSKLIKNPFLWTTYDCRSLAKA